MATLKYPESTLESRELLKQAIAFIGVHQLSASPVNYTVCYEHLLGTQPLLKQAVDQALLENIPITDQTMKLWFETFLSEYDLASLRQSQADMIGVIATLTESTIMAEDNVDQFGHSLREGEKGLVDPNSSIEWIVTHLLASTKSTQVSMGLLRQQVLQSRQEIDVLRSRLEKVTEEALTDPLTGLINRKGLTKAIETVLLHLEELKVCPCLLMIDIDHFKKINDTYGHLLGDNVINAIGGTLKNQIKGKDTAARFGGEEYCVLLPETELSDAVKVAENIRIAVEKMRIKRSRDQQEICRITISIGVARYRPGMPLADWFEHADSALYRSKEEGRNRVTFFE